MPRSVVHIVDYGVGNVGSLMNMVARLGGRGEISSDHGQLASATHVILPGVGSFDSAATRLRASGLSEAVSEAAGRGAFVLGVCLGMQLLLDGSEEGTEPGLGLIPGFCRQLPSTVDDEKVLLPHMGWNQANHTSASAALPSLGSPGTRYYFVHSYYAAPQSLSNVLATTRYGIEFPSAVVAGRVTGVQFHPEKSHRHGLALLRDFLGQGESE